MKTYFRMQWECLFMSVLCTEDEIMMRCIKRFWRLCSFRSGLLWYAWCAVGFWGASRRVPGSLSGNYPNSPLSIITLQGILILISLMQDILCNDCDKKGTAPFHWLYHKCRFCGSYNTRVIKVDSTDSNCSTSNQWGHMAFACKHSLAPNNHMGL
jgi:hypothetical protein